MEQIQVDDYFPEEWVDRDYGDENDFLLDDEEDEYEDSGGALVRNRPKPKNPLLGAEVEVPEEELVLV